MKMNNLEIKTIYEVRKVTGRSEFCPREGVYKFLSFHNGTCLGKPALMAKVLWKSKIQDTYSEDLVFTVQVESLRSTLDKKHFFDNTKELIGKEIFISLASYNTMVKLFTLTWTPISSQQNLLDQLNGALKLNPTNVDLGGCDNLDIQEDDFGSEFDFEGGI